MSKVYYETKNFSIDKIYDENYFELPRFQRGISWDNNKRRKFMETFRSGKPFGTILVFLDKNDKYVIVDGLQRISTLRDYKSNFSNYVDDIFDKKIFRDIYDNFIKIPNEIRYTYKKRFEEFENILIEIFKSKNILNLSATNIYNKITEKFSLSEDKNIIKFIAKIEDLLDTFKSKQDISNLIVPAIIYKGDESDLPDIFERINTGSVVLSKYEILASMWSKETFNIDDDEIKESIKEKYQVLQNNSEILLQFNIEDIDNEINFFEYCYAIGSLLHKKCPLLFGENKNIDKTDSLGFDLLCLISGLQVNDASNLINKFGDLSKVNFLLELKKIILKVSSQISDILEKILCGPNDSPVLVPNRYLFYHMIISYIKINYEINFDNYEIIYKNDKRWTNKFKSFIECWFIYYIISGFWQKNRQVTDLYDLSNDFESFDKYSTLVSFEKFKGALFDWIEAQNAQTKLNQISVENKLFLNFMHFINLKNNEYFKAFESKKLDIEHIIPKNRLADLKNEVPVSSICNLCYITKTTNRSKKDLTLYEYNKIRPELSSDDKLNSDLLDLINYPTEREMNFLDYEREEKKESYIKFLKDRTNFIVDKYSNLIFDYFKNRNN